MGYSGKSAAIALEIKDSLCRTLPTVSIRGWKWDFQIEQILCSELDAASRECDSAIFLITKDDDVTRSCHQMLSPRDNIIFEVGVFGARIGMGNIALIIEEGVSLPSDWGGILYIPLRDRTSLESVHWPLMTTMKRVLDV